MNYTAHQSFTELKVWKKSRILKNELKTLSDGLPIDEKYKLVDQIVQFSRSITATIAEGHGRFTFKDQLHVCVIARGSLSETYNHLIDAFDCKYINMDQLKDLKSKIDDVERLLNGYISYLRKNI